MNKNSDKNKLIKEVLTRSVSSIMPSLETFEKALLAGKRLSIYIGVDATGPHLHLGHLTNFLWMKRMQDLGHDIIILIGDFTAMIGDPTGKISTRKQLDEAEVKENMRTFKKQVSSIIYFDRKYGKNPARIERNSQWHKKMTLEKFMKDALGYFTVQNMLQRDMFKERIEANKEINLKEFIYPLLQGYDGVAMDVDAELGGNDQTFNMNVGRLLRKAHIDRGNTKKGEKFFIATTLLVNPKTGKKLMNKSEGGLINLDDAPADIFGKVMAIDDVSMYAVAEHCTFLPLERVTELHKMNPRDAKIEIASAVVEVIYGKAKAENARNNWVNIFSKKEIPKNIPDIVVSSGTTATLFMVEAKAAKSNSEAWRLVEQGAFEINGETIKDPRAEITGTKGEIKTARIGKKNFFRIKIK